MNKNIIIKLTKNETNFIKKIMHKNQNKFYSKENKKKKINFTEFDIDILNPKDVSELKIIEKKQEILKIPKWTKERIKKGKWEPTRKLSRNEMEELKTLSKSDPLINNFKFLSEKYKISSEAVKRILKSKFKPK